MRLTLGELLELPAKGEKAAANTLRKLENTAVYFFTGEDEMRKKEAIDNLVKALSSKTSVEIDKYNVEAKDVAIDDLILKTRNSGLFSEKTVIIVFGVLELKADPLRAIIDYIASPSPSTVLILASEKKGAEKSAFGIQVLDSASGALVECRKLKNYELQQWIDVKLKEIGDATGRPKKITPEAVALLYEIHSANLWTISNELEKLCMYEPEAVEISERTVHNAAGLGMDASSFKVAENISRGNRKQAIPSLEKALSIGEKPQVILAATAIECTDIMNSKAVNTGLGKPLFFPRQREWKISNLAQVAGKQSWEDLRRKVSRVFESEFNLKQGRIKWELELELLAHELTHR